MSPPDKLYHYTSRSAAGQIVDDGYIRAKKGLLGPGVYLTGLGPRTDKSRLLQNNQDSRVGGSTRLECFFEFYSENLFNLKKGDVAGRDVWYIPDNVPVNLAIGAAATNL